MVREAAESEGRSPPPWTVKFLCRRVKPDVSNDIRELIAGREQARGEVILRPSLAAKVSRFLLEEEKAVTSGASRREVMVTVFRKTAQAGDASDVVCLQSPAVAPALPGVVKGRLVVREKGSQVEWKGLPGERQLQCRLPFSFATGVRCEATVLKQPTTPPAPLCPPPSQENFIKAFNPLVEWLRRSRERAVAVVKAMEANSRITLSTFKPLEQMRDPSDFNEVTSLMEATAKPTGQLFKTTVHKVLERRWWQWCLCHPQLAGDKIHESRRMPVAGRGEGRGRGCAGGGWHG